MVAQKQFVNMKHLTFFRLKGRLTSLEAFGLRSDEFDAFVDSKIHDDDVEDILDAASDRVLRTSLDKDDDVESYVTLADLKLAEKVLKIDQDEDEDESEEEDVEEEDLLDDLAAERVFKSGEASYDESEIKKFLESAAESEVREKQIRFFTK